MNLLQVRRGQFVYYKNELHKVYSIRPLSRLSIQMYRIKDMEQVSCRAEEIDYYRPKHLDSLMFLGVKYTLRKDIQAVDGSYILITNPNPGHLDHYSLNEFEKVEKSVGDKVYTTLNNTVASKEFLVMVPEVQPDAHEIDYFDQSLVTEAQLAYDQKLKADAEEEATFKPSVGDIFLNLENGIKAMVVAVIEDEVVLGHGERLKGADLFKSDIWKLIYLNEEDDF